VGKNGNGYVYLSQRLQKYQRIFFYKTQKGIDGTDAKAGTQFLKLEDSF
jgi:hypothetical protein